MLALQTLPFHTHLQKTTHFVALFYYNISNKCKSINKKIKNYNYFLKRESCTKKLEGIMRTMGMRLF